jgi:hypothetical protein
METPRTATITMGVRYALRSARTAGTSRSLPYHRDKHEWGGPYSSEMSVTLMVARELLKGNQEPPQTVIPAMTSRQTPEPRDHR